MSEEKNATKVEETGYNKKEIENLINNINDSLEKTGEAITDSLYEGIILPMSTAWYAPEAQEFFEEFKEEVKASGQVINTSFDNFRLAIQKAGELWAQNTQGEVPVLPEVTGVELNLNITPIQSEDNGRIVINGNEAAKVAMSLSEIEEEIKSKIASITRNLDLDTSFIGRGQSQAILNCFTDIYSSILDFTCFSP